MRYEELKKIAYLIDIPRGTLLTPYFEEKKRKVLESEDIELLKDFVENATDEEVLYVIMQKSLEVPLSEELTNIMLFLYNRIFPKELIPKDLTYNYPLSEWEQGILKDLRQKIRKKQVEKIKKAVKKLGVC